MIKSFKQKSFHRHKGILLLLFMIFTLFGFAQNSVISGTVTDNSGQPLPGVNVLEKGGANGVVTDFDGNYSLSVNSNATLVFSFIGFVTQEVSVSGRSTINVSLSEDVEALDEVIVVGYGQTDKKSLTGSVAAVSDKNLIKGFNVTASQAIQGKVAGLSIQEGSGAPGGSARINIRGITSLAANTQPLFIVDGVALFSGGASNVGGAGNSVNTTNPFDFINPNDIKSVSVLKGPSAIAIYGNRGANGVIIITTKSGQVQQSYVQLSANTTLTTPGRKINVYSADEYRTVAAEEGIVFNDLGASTDWQDEILSSAVSTQYNLSAGGGNDKSTYYGSMSWTDEEGTLLGSGNKRLTGRLRYTQKAFNDRLNIDINSSFSTNSTDFSPVQVNGGGSATPPILGMALRYNPTAPVYNPDGSFFEVGFPDRENWNPVAMALQQNDNLKRRTFVSQLNVSYDLIPEVLTAKGTFNILSSNSTRRFIYPPNSQRGANSGNGLASLREVNSTNLVGEGTLAYKKTFNDSHNLDVVVGYSYQETKGDGTQLSQTNLLSDALGVNMIGIGDPASLQVSVFEGGDNIRSYFGRVNYDFAKKYFITGVFRRDGSALFSQGEPWGNFPSGAVAWRVSEEDFLNDSSVLNELKIRAEWGVVGNNAIPGLETVGRSQLSFNGQSFVITPNALGNPNLTWETTTTTNFGVDFGLFNNRVSGSFDIYDKVTKDLFLRTTVPAPTIDGNLLINAGEMQNKGVEVSLTGRIIEPKTADGLSLSTTLVMAYNKNEITSLSGNGFDQEFISYGSLFGPSFVGDDAFRIEVGEPIHSFYGPTFAGLNADGNETYLNNDGSITDNRSEADENYLGNAIPELTFSFTTNLQYKNFDVSLQLRGATGGQIVNNSLLEFGQPTFLTSGFNIVKDGFQEPNAALTTAHEFSSRFLSDSDFIRLENLTVGYNFNVNNFIGVSSLRLYFSGRNLFTITGYDGGDPESFSDSRNDNNVSAIYGVDFLGYPRPKIYSLGLNVNF